MPRPKKCRKVCCMPRNNAFGPVGDNGESLPPITMTVEEYETIRLIDYQDFTQEQCSQYMNIARTTAQQIYNDARKKLAMAIVDARSLRIEGGDYRLCDGSEANCGCGGCRRHRFSRENQVKGEPEQ